MIGVICYMAPDGSCVYFESGENNKESLQKYKDSWEGSLPQEKLALYKSTGRGVTAIELRMLAEDFQAISAINGWQAI